MPFFTFSFFPPCICKGHETKALLNNNGPRYKRSKLERQMNTDVFWCVLILLIMCLLSAVGKNFFSLSFNS